MLRTSAKLRTSSMLRTSAKLRTSAVLRTEVVVLKDGQQGLSVVAARLRRDHLLEARPELVPVDVVDAPQVNLDSKDGGI